jgi:hypothetical protein
VDCNPLNKDGEFVSKAVKGARYAILPNQHAILLPPEEFKAVQADLPQGHHGWVVRFADPVFVDRVAELVWDDSDRCWRHLDLRRVPPGYKVMGDTLPGEPPVKGKQKIGTLIDELVRGKSKDPAGAGSGPSYRAYIRVPLPYGVDEAVARVLLAGKSRLPLNDRFRIHEGKIQVFERFPRERWESDPDSVRPNTWVNCDPLTKDGQFAAKAIGGVLRVTQAGDHAILLPPDVFQAIKGDLPQSHQGRIVRFADTRLVWDDDDRCWRHLDLRRVSPDYKVMGYTLSGEPPATDKHKDGTLIELLTLEKEGARHLGPADFRAPD